MSGYDPRDPDRVATSVVASVRKHWVTHPPTKPVLLMLQGDPLTERGISAITRQVANALCVPRALIVLDEAIADYHFNADRGNVVLETRYSVVAAWFESYKPGILDRVDNGIQALIQEKNRERAASASRHWLTTFHSLRCCKRSLRARFSALCGEMTLVHTSREVVAASVSSFLHRWVGARALQPALHCSLRR